MGVKPAYSSGFEVPAEGLYMFQVQEVEFEEKEKGLQAKVKSEIIAGEHAEAVGIPVTEYYPLYVEFGFARFLGFMVKAAGIPEKEYELGYFDAPKAQKRAIDAAVNSQFGGKVKHDKLPARTEGGDPAIFAKIKDVYTKNEIVTMLKDKEGKKSEKKAEKSSAKAEEKKAEAPAEAEGDSW